MAGTIDVLAEGQGYLIGRYTGTGAAININLGFVPVALRGINITDGDAGYTWMYGMDAGSCITEGAEMAYETTTAVTTLDGSAGNGIGVSLGANSIINETDKVYLIKFER